MSAAGPANGAERHYVRALDELNRSGIPYMIGGAYALREYAGIFRDTKDLDIFCREQDCPQILETLAAVAFETELTDPLWLAKAFHGDHLIDVIFNSGNGLSRVDDSWLQHAKPACILGCRVLLVPAEELIWSKVYVQERDRFDGADIIHIIRRQGPLLDWRRLLERMGPYWEVLFAHLIAFRFVYPTERDKVPEWLVRELLRRVERQLTSPPPLTPVCRGTLLSRVQYEVDTSEWGYLDARDLAAQHAYDPADKQDPSCRSG